MRNRVKIIPVDSEHSAIMQCLWERRVKEVKRLILTASGGPFYNKGDIDLSKITPKMALEHPTWKMGHKVTIDSSTLMNKGFEVIEASCLFGIPIDRIDVVIHPESIIHALVEFIDGSVIALMHAPNMCIPIQYAISWPDRWEGRYGEVSLADIGKMHFFKPDNKRFPALDLAYHAGSMGGTMPAVLSAADEVCVEKFINGKILYSDIVRIIKNVMDTHRPITDPTLADILSADKWAREMAEEVIKG